MSCLMFMLNPKDDIYIAYLPLAHVLELLSENTMMLFGIKVMIITHDVDYQMIVDDEHVNAFHDQ